jgi:hypothetical protein
MIDDKELWDHNCAPIKGTKGWTEVRVRTEGDHRAPTVGNTRGEVKMFLGLIAYEDRSVWFVRYFFEDARDARDFRTVTQALQRWTK